MNFLFTFPAYLQGMETSISGVSLTMWFASSQPTYKEWKLLSDPAPLCAPGGFPAYLQGMETGGGEGSQLYAPEFPAYLQGMETGKLEEHLGGDFQVPSLPTRNGNGRAWKGGLCKPFVPSLPTRNGNPARPPSSARAISQCSQPTYKEWKHPTPRALTGGWVGSQPTYKEWKPATPLRRGHSCICCVPSLPTRNGNPLRSE